MATIDTIADRSTGSAIAGKAYFETSTNKFIVYNGSAWIEIDSDGTGAVFENRWGASFDGVNDYLNIPASTDFDFGTGAFTYSLWFNLSDYGLNSGGKYGGLIYRALNHRVKFQNDNKIINFSIPGGELQIVNAASSLLDAWHHIAIVRDTSDNTIKCYLDAGTPTSSSVSASVDFSSAGNDILLGRQATHWPLEGLMDEFAIFNTALDQTAITALYGGGTPSEVTGSVGYWRMGDDSNDTAVDAGLISGITDSSGNGNDATTVATSQPTFKALAQSTTSLSFDGSDHLTTNYTPASSTGATMSIWYKSTSFTKTSGLITSGTTTSAALGNFNLMLNTSTNGFYVQVGDGTNSSLHNALHGFGSHNDITSASAPGYLFDGLWHHLVVTIDGTALKMYLDGGDKTVNASRSNTQGTPYQTATSSIAYTGNVGNIHIGKGHPTFSPNMEEAYVDDFAYFEYALTASQVSALYNSGVPGNSGSYTPSIWLRMGEDDSLTDGQTGIAQITDASGNGNHATQATASNQPTASIDPVIYV